MNAMNIAAAQISYNRLGRHNNIVVGLTNAPDLGGCILEVDGEQITLILYTDLRRTRTWLAQKLRETYIEEVLELLLI